jgi:hypothetical protein
MNQAEVVKQLLKALFEDISQDIKVFQRAIKDSHRVDQDQV